MFTAYGYYGGSHALAVGFSGTNEERNFVYKLSGSVNNKGNLAFGVGAGVMLGEENENNYPEKVKKEKVRKRQF
ncbi:YadA-like family protein [Sneathia vaginalis]|uniref:YadA-like family protein n=1 Tax=Sneathia vaginalis TaxID=187101 RepID=UPI0035CFB874